MGLHLARFAVWLPPEPWVLANGVQSESRIHFHTSLVSHFGLKPRQPHKFGVDLREFEANSVARNRAHERLGQAK